ncbi:FAD-binding oxidoreductase [Pararhodobacter sp.]|uniref:FAD-binding oxidoreductase n=1 Tax=Pararhodobacter sp. TaxID=2127056 RepID=UPI002FDC8738
MEALFANYPVVDAGIPSDRLDRLVADLGAILKPDQIVVGAAARQRYPGDQSWLTIAFAAHDRPLNRPDIVVAPTSTEQVAAVMRLAHRAGVPVTPIAGASGVQGAANANCGGLQIDLRRMDRIRHLDPLSQTCTVEAGLIIRTFESWLTERGWTFTHDPASAEWASVGGAVAARGSGVLSSKYGNIQDHVLSLEVVMPDGDVVSLPAVPKHGVGPELTQLFVGSEGTLGVITAVRVKIRRQPAKRSFAAFAFETLSEGIAAGREIMVSGLRPPVMRLYDQDATHHSLARMVENELTGPVMIIMTDGDHAALVDLEAALCAEVCAAHGGRPLGSAIGEAWWANRYALSHPPFAPSLPQIWCTMDAVADYAHIEQLYTGVTDAIRGAVGPEWSLGLKTHLSHWFEWGAMIYPRITIPNGPADLETAVALHDSIVRAASVAALKAGGLINDHHGVGMRLAPFMADQFGPEGMRLLQAIKRGIDPQNTLCPGKLNLL